MSKALRIAHVALQLETGGMERLLVEFARRADRRRFEMRFVALGSRGRVADDIEAAGCRVTTLNARSGVHPALVYKLARMFRDERIDLVHTHNTRPLLYAGPAARVAGVRGVVHTRHGQRRGATPRQDLLFRLAARCADRIVCVSEDSRRLCGVEGLHAGSIRTIPNGIDTGRFSFRGPSAGGPAVYVGRLSPEKDVATLLRATARVVAECSSFRLQIAGAGPCGPEVAALRESLALNGSVELLGCVSDVPRLLAGASQFVLPSLTEGLPLTALEAMACGLPVVATRIGGTPEAVEHGVNGLLVPPGDPEALAAAMRRVHEAPEDARRMGMAGYQRAAALFDVGTMMRRYESLYDEVLGGAEAAAA